jgi:hypothetical protein
MRCERAGRALIDRQAGALSAEDTTRLEAHLSRCSACRAEAASIEGLWAGLGALRVARPDPAATERIARALRLAAATPVARTGWHWLRAAAYAGVLLLGAVVGRLTAPATGPVAEGEGYLLLLRSPENAPDASSEVVSEYSSWARRLLSEGRLLAAEKLADDAAWLPARNDAQVVSGFVLVKASGMAEAEAIARGGPHLSRGGTIELRRIESTGGR